MAELREEIDSRQRQGPDHGGPARPWWGDRKVLHFKWKQIIYLGDTGKKH